MTPICIKRVFILLLNTILIMIMPIIHNQTLANIIHDKNIADTFLDFTYALECVLKICLC